MLRSAETQSENQFKIISNNPRQSKFFFNQSTRIANFCPTISLLARRWGQSANFHDEEIWGQISVFKPRDREKEMYNLFQPIKDIVYGFLAFKKPLFFGKSFYKAVTNGSKKNKHRDRLQAFLQKTNVYKAALQTLKSASNDNRTESTTGSLPWPRQQQKPHKFAYLAVKNIIFARFARAFFIFWHFEDVLVLSRDVTWPVLQLCGRREHMMTNVQFCPLKRYSPLRYLLSLMCQPEVYWLSKQRILLFCGWQI